MRSEARTSRRVAGTSLIELVVAIVVISIALTGTMLVVDTTTRQSTAPMLERQALSIASAYLTEAVALDYLDPETSDVCPTPEATRNLYDNVCDFDGLDQTGVRDQFDTAITGLEGYRVQIDVVTNASLGALTGPNDVLRIDSTVTDPTGRRVVLSAFRTNR